VNQKTETVDALLKLGADPNQKKFNNTDTPFFNAVEFTDNQTCNLNKVKLLLDYGANVNDVFIDIRDLGGNKQNIQLTALMIACREGCLNLVKLLIAKGANINQYTYYEGYGAITVALAQENIEIAKYLIVDKKAKIPEYIVEIPAGVEAVNSPARRKTISDVLYENDYSNQPKKQGYKEEILAYLKSIGKH
jgi:ankyrin repeat protein